MTLTKLDQATTIWPVLEDPFYGGGEFVLDLFVCPLGVVSWGAYGVVLRGMPADWGMDPHPNFAGVGATKDQAVDAMLEALNDYLDGNHLAFIASQRQ